MKVAAIASVCVVLVLSLTAITRDDSATRSAGRHGPAQALDVKYAPTPEEVAEIKSLIADLRKIADPHVGLSPTMSGSGFAPVPWAFEMHNGILMNHGLRPSRAFTRLVEYGPKALPYLLEALDDPTETGLTVEHSGWFGSMWYAEPPAVRWASDSLPQPLRELNPRRLIEQELLEEVKQEPHSDQDEDARLVPIVQSEHDTNSVEGANSPFEGLIRTQKRAHTVTVGDVCYVIIGQIVNRTYLAVQYQPTACIYITSPVVDPDVREFVRRAWGSDAPAQTLFDSLVTDFRTGYSASPFWTDYTASATLRLSLYFPEESEPLFLEYLDGVNLAPSEERHWLSEDVETVKAMTVTTNRRVRRRIVEIAMETTDPDLFESAVRAVPRSDAQLAFRRTSQLVESLRHHDTYESSPLTLVFESLCETFPDECEGFFAEFLRSATPEEATQLCFALRYTEADVPVGNILAPLLKDDRMTEVWSKPVRLRDFAAESIAQYEANVEFDPDAPEEERDEQITRIWEHCTGIGVTSRVRP